MLLLPMIGVEVQAPDADAPAGPPPWPRPKRCKGAWCRLKLTRRSGPSWRPAPSPEADPRKKESLRKRIAKRAKPLARPKRA